MVDVNKAAEHAIRHFNLNAAAFYGSAAGLSLGVGLIYEGVNFPLFNESEGLFDTAQGLAFILTHECDIDQANERHFNDCVLICPIIKFEEFAVEFADNHSEAALMGLLPDIAQSKVYRVQYLPPIPPHVASHVLPFGGFLYLNQICSTHVTVFRESGSSQTCALSSYALQAIDYKLKNHLFRPKVQILPRLM